MAGVYASPASAFSTQLDPEFQPQKPVVTWAWGRLNIKIRPHLDNYPALRAELLREQQESLWSYQLHPCLGMRYLGHDDACQGIDVASPLEEKIERPLHEILPPPVEEPLRFLEPVMAKKKSEEWETGLAFRF